MYIHKARHNIRIVIFFGLLGCAALFFARVTHAAIPTGFTVRDMPSGQSSLLTDFAFTSDGSYFTTSKNGQVSWVSANGTSKTIAVLSVETTNDLGLTGIGVAHDYTTSKKIYISRAINLGGQWNLRLSAYTVTGTDQPVGLINEQVFFTLPANSDSHAINGIQVASDGTLWVGIGDSADYRFVDPLALRALDINQGYGKILHIRPDGSGVSTNPYYDSANPFSWKSRVYASGFRNPFRLSLDPANGAPIAGDVGWGTYEEINLVRPGANYGWPCWEGDNRTTGYQDLAGCTGIGNSRPLNWYLHGSMGTSVVGGIIYTGTSYPEAYRDAYFFGDYSSGRIYTLKYDAQGTLVRGPEPNGFITANGAPVKFAAMANGDIVYADILGSKLKRISYLPGNRAPTAVVATQTDPATRTVTFDGRSSSDPDGDELSFTWDFGDGTSANGEAVSHTYAAPGTSPLNATLTVRDISGAAHSTTVTVVPANHSPIITLVTPPASTTYKVGDTISLTASATDEEDGELITHWKTTVVHCSAGICHDHPGVELDGSSYTKSFDDHGDDTKLIVTVSAKDQFGVVSQKTFMANPKLRTLTIVSTVPAAVSINGSPRATTSVTVGAKLSLTAPITATDGVASFDHWENSSGRERTFIMPDNDTTVTATYLTPIDRRYNAESGLQSLMGGAIGPEAGDKTLRYRDYMNGRLYWTPRSGVHEMHGRILFVYKTAGAHVLLGEPTTDEISTPDGIGRFNHFYGTTAVGGGASIYWTPSTDAQLIYGQIREKWAAMGWEKSVHGYPISSEATTPNGRARFNNFQNGGIYWTASGGPKSIFGAIYQKWAAFQWEQGILGLPITDEISTPDGIGRFNHFEGQNGSIYWTSSTGAHVVQGAIKARWSNLGWERSYLGYPTSDEFSISGGRRSNFQYGYITWNAATSQVVDRRY